MPRKNMKMMMIVYNHSLDDEMIELLKNNNVAGYTKIEGVIGEGDSEPHMGTNVWPSTNNIVFVAMTAAQLKKVKADGKALSAEFEGEGLRAFVFELTEVL